VCVACCSAKPQRQIFDEYAGEYRTSDNHFIGIDSYTTEDTHESRLIYSDYATGIVRLMSATSESEFSVGPAFNVFSPVAFRLKFVKNGTGAVTGLKIEGLSKPETTAERIALIQQDVNFQSRTVTLAGTLLIPATKSPHPGIILLHGSGPLTRNSFGPYPHFFTSLGFEVLVYDKRGTGE